MTLDKLSGNGEVNRLRNGKAIANFLLNIENDLYLDTWSRLIHSLF